MTKGRPFSDTEFKPNGRPFNDPDHRNYSKFNPDPEYKEPEVEEPVVDEEEDAPTLEDLVQDPAEDKGNPATTDPNVLNNQPEVVEDPLLDKGEAATVEITDEVAFATTFALLPEDDLIEVVDPLVPTIAGTDEAEKIKGTNKDDIIFGGDGADKFMVKKGNDIILDFEVGVDSLKGKFKDIEFSMLGDSTLMEHKKGSVLFNEIQLTAVDIFG